MAVRSKRSTSLGAAHIFGSLVQDDFNRADGNLAGTAASTGQSWSGGGCQIATNTVRPAGTSGAATSLDVGRADFTITVTVAAVDSTNSHFPFFVARYVDDNNYLLFQQQDATHYYFGKRVAGTYTQLALIAAAPTVGDVLQIASTGSTVTALVNGVSGFAGAVTDMQTATRVGFGCGNTANTARYDNLRVDG